jgi:hypothetical protein
MGRASLLVIALAAAFGSALSSGCAHTMIIETEPAGARVSIDGKPVGDSPVVTTQYTSTGGRLHVTVDADNYEPAHVTVTQSEWFLWPAILAVVPLFGVPFVVIPILGPIITVGWAVVTSPTLLSLVFLQKYPERVKVTLRPRGFLQPTDSWLIPDDMDPNPPPLPREPKEKGPPADYTPQPPQPDGGNPVP